MRTLLASLLLIPSLSFGQCFSPDCPSDAQFSGPGELCIRDQCQPVTYTQVNDIAIAESYLPNGFAVIGWAGPCLKVPCADLPNQAFNDLRNNALKANRAQEAE